MAAAPGPPALPGPPAPAPAPAAPVAADPQAELKNSLLVFRRDQLYFQQKFSMYRNGDVNHLRSLGHIRALRRAGQPAHWDRMVARRVPRANYQGIFTDGERLNLQHAANVQAADFDDPRAMRPLSRDDRANARREVSRAGQMMNDNMFRFIKYLGHGGMGLVTLWEYRQPGRRQVRRLVLKISTDSRPGPQPGPSRVAVTDDIQWEKTFMTVGLFVSVLNVEVNMLIHGLLDIETSPGTAYSTTLRLRRQSTTKPKPPHRCRQPKYGKCPRWRRWALVYGICKVWRPK